MKKNIMQVLFVDNCYATTYACRAGKGCKEVTNRSEFLTLGVIPEP